MRKPVRLASTYIQVNKIRDDLQLIERKLENSLRLIDTGKVFLNRTPIDQLLRAKLRVETYELKSFCIAKETITWAM